MDFELKLIDPIRNRRRLYSIVEATTLFGEPCLILTWGRIGGRYRTRTEVFDDHVGMCRRRDELLRRRRQRGYALTSGDAPLAMAA